MNMARFDMSSEKATDKTMLSAIVVIEQNQDPTELLSGYRRALDALEIEYELIAVTDARDENLTRIMDQMKADWPQLVFLAKRPWGSDDAALAAAAKRVNGDLVLTLAGWPEIAAGSIGQMLEALGDHDMVVATRSDRAAPEAQGMRTRVLHGMLKFLFGSVVKDVFCRARLIRREVLDDVASFGVRQHFIPTIAAERGYSVVETVVEPVDAQTAADTRFVFKPLGHIRALFDAAALYVVLKFLRRPLRFFGSIGLPIFVIGLISTAALIVGRLFGDTALADRPALIFSVLMIVLGVQIIALGLVGEIIIFANNRRMKQYMVQSVIRKDPEE